MSVQDGPGAAQGFAGRIFLAWTDLRGSFRALLASDPGEGRLLSLAMFSGILAFLGAMALLRLSPAAASTDEDTLIGQISAEFIGALFFRTMMLYGVAALATLALRGLGHRHGWRDGRAALFWSAAVTAPVLLLSDLIYIPVTQLDTTAAGFVQAVGPIAFGWAWSACLAELHSFRHIWSVFVTLAGVTLLIVVLLSLVFAL
ncbi:MAG: hypothetical protein AAF713_07910 [Pseudomonadota bacterium]